LVPKVIDKKEILQNKTLQPNTLELIKPVLGVTIKNANMVVKGPEGNFENMSIIQYRKQFKTEDEDKEKEKSFEDSFSKQPSINRMNSLRKDKESVNNLNLSEAEIKS